VLIVGRWIQTDSIPIGDCDSRILAYKLQFWQNCAEGISALLRSGNSPGYVRPHSHRSSHFRRHYHGTGKFPAPLSSFGALGVILARRAVGFSELTVSLLRLFGRQEHFRNG